MTFSLKLEAAWGADLTADPSTWTWDDVTADWLQTPLNIRRGRPDEAGQHQPASASFTLLNDSGDYTPDFATGAHYPNVVVDTPVRASVEVADAWLADGLASAPDEASLDITGDMFVGVDFTSSGVNNEELARKAGSAGQRSWLLFRQNTSDFVFRHSTDGTALSTFELRRPYLRGCIGVHLDVDNGASGHTVTWFWKNEWTDAWEEIASETASGTTSVFASTADLEVGSSTLPQRRVRHFELRSGDETGTEVANPDFTVQTAGDTSFEDDAGLTWTVDAGEITDQEVRFFGNAASFNPYWPVGGISQADPHARCDVTAAGVLRRLRQGKTVLGPALNRTILTLDNLVAYWPMDDGTDATRAYSPMAGVAPTRYVDPADDFSPGSSDNTPAGSNPLLVFPGPMASTGVVGNIPPSTVGTFTVAVLYYADAAPASEGRFLDVHTSTGYRWRVSFTTTSATVYLHRGGDLVDSTATGFTSAIFGRWVWLLLTATQDGSDVDWQLSWFVANGDNAAVGDTYTGVSIGYPRTFTLSGDDGWAAGHLYVLDAEIAEELPTTAYTGDLTGERVSRLATEAGVDVDVFWPSENGSAMGPQPIASWPDAMEDCATTETGILSERIDGPGLVFQTRETRYNRPLLGFSAADLAMPFRPTGDDQGLKNDITVERPDGSSAHAVDPDARATYEESVSLNVETDDDLPDAASWLLHIGTWPGMRYPTIVFQLHGSHATDAYRAKVLSLIPGDVVRITDLPTQHPAGDVDLIIEGWTETITPFTWTIACNCSPAGPWTVGVLEDDVLGRADTAGSELDAAIDDNDTAIDVATTLGPVWIDDGAFSSEFPFDIVIGGEVMTVTANSDTTSPQTFTVTRSVNGVVKSHADGSAVRLAHPLVLAR